jgi:hypothetical protein
VCSCGFCMCLFLIIVSCDGRSGVVVINMVGFFFIFHQSWATVMFADLKNSGIAPPPPCVCVFVCVRVRVCSISNTVNPMSSQPLKWHS